MKPVPDLEQALSSFQKALLDGQLQLRACELDQTMFVHVDRPRGPNGEVRMTYVRLEGQTVVSLVVIVTVEPYDGKPCFNVGWATAQAHRGQGNATGLFIAAANELRNGLARHGAKGFYLEAIVETDNTASQHVAQKVLSKTSKAIEDSEHGVPVNQYVRWIATDSMVGPV